MIHRRVAFNPAFVKIADELIVNARDSFIRSKEPGKTPIKHIDITCSVNADGVLEVGVENDGDGIIVQKHPEHKMWVPELIFGNLLSSGNYHQTGKIVGGKNGYGAKLVNIFSNEFRIEIRSPVDGLSYKQTWRNNMSVCEKPSVTKTSVKTGYVKVFYKPDCSRFKDLNIEDMTTVLHTRAVEMAGLCVGVKVSWNGTVIASNTFEKFVRLFVKDSATSSVAYELCSERWKVAAILTRNLYEDDAESVNSKTASADGGSRAISFVNGINVRRGGKHVQKVVSDVLGEFCELAAKKKVPVKPAQIRDAVVFFLDCTIEDPSFDSQSKETLTTPVSKFGSVFKSVKMADNLIKLGLLEDAQNALAAKEAKEAKKTDGVKRKTLRGYPKLEDALWAGSAKSSDCTLILTEGDSAATSAISGLNVVGRERFGVFPLRGKLLNVKDISQDKFNKNEELTAIKAILGLRQGAKYKSLESLRYGRVMVMTDSDVDGIHISGLLMNLFHTEWPELLKMGFLCSLATPLLKATRRNESISFYSESEFNRWRLTPAGSTGSAWSVKYYKGLGTSTKAEAREWFEKMAEVRYGWDDNTDASMSLAFHKKNSDLRKQWLEGFQPDKVLELNINGANKETSIAKVTFTQFVNESLIHFSNANNIRSLPSIMDGLKPSQRKILFGCLKRGLRSEIKVAQLAGYVSEHSSYHHGEVSLCDTIVGMAQQFVGSNNLNLLVPNGQFGSRRMGGKDAASARYIFTYLDPVADAVFRKEDASILRHLEDDGMSIEPETYLPVVPMLLVNGCIGIGTGFSTDIPPYNPVDLVARLRDRLLGRLSSLAGVVLRPWWAGFKGAVVADEGTGWTTKGVYTLNNANNTITITELPVGVWTNDYKTFLDEMCSADATEKKGAAFDDGGRLILTGFDSLSTDDEVKFILSFEPDVYEDMKAHPEEFEKRFRLTSSWRTTNMVAFNATGQITRYPTVGSILEGYFAPRLAAYEVRRQREAERLEAVAVEADATARFLRAVLEGVVDLRRATDESIVLQLRGLELPALSGAADTVDGYEYLLRLRMDRVKASAIEAAEARVAAARSEAAALREATAEGLWLKDLSDFETAWGKMRVRREAEATASAGAGARAAAGNKAAKAAGLAARKAAKV
jgi:DNA topoisomerase-2